MQELLLITQVIKIFNEKIVNHSASAAFSSTLARGLSHIRVVDDISQEHN